MAGSWSASPCGSRSDGHTLEGLAWPGAGARRPRCLSEPVRRRTAEPQSQALAVLRLDLRCRDSRQLGAAVRGAGAGLARRADPALSSPARAAIARRPVALDHSRAWSQRLFHRPAPDAEGAVWRLVEVDGGTELPRQGIARR